MGDDSKATHTIYINCEDTLRYSLASHLSMAFRRKGLSAFVNSKGTQDVIEQGSTFVLLLSINFVSSALCLNKLVRVLEWRMENGLLVVPVFYGVSPSDVVAPEHESADRRREWTNALQELIELPGYHSREEHSDCKLVEEIVEDVYEKLFPTEQIGISSRLLEIELLLCKQPWGIRRLGIWGMPGIGKTTLARAFFDQVSGGYEASCFIKHFDKAFRDKGLHRLLAEHFGEILKELPRLCNSFTRPRLPRHKLNKKRTLVVLDDVHNPLIAESFLGGFHWFGPGSLIIITSRDKQVFRLCQISHVYEVRSLNMNESLQLFSNCAFEKDMRAQNFMELSKKVTEYANGNPLVLGLYGRELKGKKLLEMETAFLDLKKRTPNKIYDLLKSTFETLNDSEKNIFLDIACFFKGENVNYVMQLFEGCGFFPHDGIDVLVEKCLVTISENTVKMHNLVQAFGQELINGETAQIERRRRLWEPRNIKVLLEDDELEGNGDPEATYTRPLGTEDIEGIFLDRANLIFDVKPGAFENMFNLRFLKIYSSSYKYQYELCLRKGLEYLPYELRLLHWENYPLQSLPQDFDPGHLVELNMPYSQLQKLWGVTKNLERLKMVRLCHSQQLTEIDDICKAQNIELIDLQGCTKLQSVPATGQLKHLRVVNLSGCREINSFPEVSPNIEELHLQGTSIRELPISIVTLSRQDKLNLELSNLLTEFSDALNIEQLTSLVKVVSSNKHLGKLIFLNMKYCSHLRNLPDMVDLESLRVLHLSGCSNLESIQGFPRNLKELYLAGTAIKELPQLPQSLEVLNAHSCVLLKSIPSGFKQLPSYYTFSDCSTLSSQAVSEFVVKVLSNVGSLVREYQQKQELNRSLAFSFMVPSRANNRCTLQPGSSVMIRLGPSWRSMLMGFAMLVEVAFSEEAIDFGLRCVCRWNDKEGVSYRLENTFSCWTGGEGVPKVQKDNLFVFCDLSLHPSCGERKDPDLLADVVVFEFFPVNKQKQLLDGSCTVTKCGVYVITAANEDTSLNMTQRVSSLDHTKKLSGSEAEEELMNIYDGLDMKDKNLFDYILCLFNNEETDVVARHIDSIGLEIGSGFEALADKSLIHISPYGVIVPPHLLQKLGRGIVRRSAWPSTLLPDSSCGSSSSSVVMSKVDMDSDCLDSEILWEDLTIGVRIGLGSCGTVYRGLWFEYDVAVKMFSKQEYSEEVITSFRQEVSFMKKLRHPNVLLILGAVASPRRLCIVTEFLPRGSLFRLLQRNTSKLDWPLRIQMASDIARGMNYLHHCSPPIIHGDLKSSNLLVDRNWTVKVADFGLSRIKYEMYLTTKTGRGTPQWMAPEVLRNEAADEKSDVYSFGVILWELVTEKIPWENLNAMQVIGAVGFMTQRLEVPKDVDPLWISIMESCWHSEPQRRPSFQELMEKLRELKRKYTIQLQEASAASIDNQVASVEQNQNQPFLSISPSVSHRFKSFNLYNNFISQEPITVAEESPPPEAKPEVEEEETNPSIEELFSNPNVNHVARSNTDTEPASGSIPPKLPKKMKKSASTKSPFPHFENDETYVEAPRPETVRVKRVTTVEEADKEVDAKAADFINRFKHQLKLQRIDSITKYKEMVKKINDK